MAQSSKKQAEEAVLDLKGKLRQLNKTLATKGATIAENAPLVATIKAVEGMKEQAVTMSIFRRQQFFGYVDESLPPMRISGGYNPALIDYCFGNNRALKSLPNVENLDVAVNMSSYAVGCSSIIDVSLGALTNATEMTSAFSGCSSLASVTIGAAPNITNVSNIFFGCNSLKDVSIDLSGGRLTNFSSAFFGCSSLRRVTGTIDLSNADKSTNTFQGCSSLEEVRIKGLKIDLDLSYCVNLSVESVKYLVENAQAVSGKRIDLSRALLDANEEALGDIGDTASDKGWTLNYK